jgi:hypothetical protein
MKIQAQNYGAKAMVHNKPALLVFAAFPKYFDLSIRAGFLGIWSIEFGKS